MSNRFPTPYFPPNPVEDSEVDRLITQVLIGQITEEQFHDRMADARDELRAIIHDNAARIQGAQDAIGQINQHRRQGGDEGSEASEDDSDGPRNGPGLFQVPPLRRGPFQAGPAQPQINQPEDFTQWPLVPRVLPRQTPDLFRYTSLGRPSGSHSEPIPPSVEQQERDRTERELQANEQADVRHARRQAEQDSHNSQRANQTWDRLRAHYATLPALEGVFESSVKRFAEESPEQHAAFETHMKNAKTVTSAGVREMDILTWFSKTKLPHFVRLPLESLQRYFHDEAHLKYELGRYEVRAGGGCGEPFHSHMVYAAERYGHQHKFGYEGSRSRLEFETYSSEGGAEDVLDHLMASFEVRKVRVEHAPIDMRFPAKPWDRSLDNSLLKFMYSVHTFLSEYEGDGLTEEIKKAIQVKIETFGNEKMEELSTQISHNEETS